jgi:S1-C subfamily serine protease
VNALDVALIVLLILAAFAGARRGLVLQLFSYGGLLAGLTAGALLAPVLASLVSSPIAQAATAAVTLLVAAAIGDGIGWLVGSRARARARSFRFGTAVDAPAGATVSLVAVLLATWFIALNLVNGPFPSVSSEVRGSVIVRTLDRALPQPPSVLAEVRRFFNTFGFPDVFSGIPPAPAAPVRPPTQRQAHRAFEEADQSTLRIVGQACGRIQEGSGFVVADGYVLTNAHVVAGVARPQVQSEGSSQDAVTVLFDPRIDLAVLSVANTPSTLDLDGSIVDRGTTGAVLGYPKGGPLTGQAAAVRDSYPAVGHDIYDSGSVQREIYELQTIVRPGNSGGPFVLLDGRVAGIVFAASTTDPGIGYAISSREAMPDVRSAIGRTQAVSTGPCLR